MADFEAKAINAKEMFMNIERFGTKPYQTIFPSQYQIEECNGDEECLAGLEHSLSYTWQVKGAIAWICFDYDDEMWFAGEIDKEMTKFLDIKEDFTTEDLRKYHLSNGWMFSVEETKAIIQQIKELGWDK